MSDYGSSERGRAPFIQDVGTLADLVSVTLTLDTSAYGSGDLIAETQEIAGAVRKPGGTAILQSLLVYDQDDQGSAIDIYILGSNVTMGTENSAPSISDANALNIQAIIPIAAADYKGLGGVKIANIKNIGAVVEAAAGSTSLYVAVVSNASTPTYTASGVKLAFGLAQD